MWGHGELLLLQQFRESVAERGHDARHERGEEAFLRAEHLLAVAHRAPEDASEHVAAPLVRGHGAVGDGAHAVREARGDDEREYMYLVKGGEDIRNDESAVERTLGELRKAPCLALSLIHI